MGAPHLKLVDTDLADRCGGETRDGSPCLRRTGGGRCHDHAEAPPAGPPPPEYLGDYGKEEWNRRIEELASSGMLEAVDIGLLEALCDVYHEVRACRDHVDEHGRTVQGRGESVKKNPAHSKLLKFRKEYRLCVKDLRSHLKDATAEPEGDGSDDGSWSDW